VTIPVIAIDGPSASGKGTVAARVARELGFHYLDSGALYRLVALVALDGDIDLDDEAALAQAAESMEVEFGEGSVRLGGVDVTGEVRAEDVGAAASRVAAKGAVRQALLARQRRLRRPPGLVADGRDMGTVVFPDSPLKIFLTASVEQRAARRHNQLISRGNPANIDSLLADLRMRDERDQNRAVAPLKPAEDAVLLDNSGMSIDEGVEFVLEAWDKRRR
jgi:cytidylate kinase